MAESFMDRLRDALVEANLNQQQLAKLSHIDPGHLSRLARGITDANTVSMELATALADALSVTVDWLFTGRGPRKHEGQPEPVKDVLPSIAAGFAARQLGIRDEAIEYVLKRYSSQAYADTTKYPARWWFKKMDSKNDQLTALEVRKQMSFTARGSAELAERRERRDATETPASVEPVATKRARSRR